MTSPEQARRNLAAAERLLHMKRAKQALIPFVQYTMPNPTAPDDVLQSRYDARPHHRAIGEALDRVERGEIDRLAVMCPPRHGKSELTTRNFPPFFVGRDPYRSVMVGTYNQPFADDFGRSVRAKMQSPRFLSLFPGCTLRKGETASDRLRTEEGGLLAFVGRGGTITGRGADLLVIDDPFKGSEEADSAATREDVWTWYNRDIITRCMTDRAAAVIIMTRWHEDDLLGRLLDPGNPCYDSIEAKRWHVINMPALAEDDDAFGREKGDPLWPERFGREYLTNFKRRDPRGFSALYQQRPSAEDGEFFRTEMLVTYKLDELPKRMRFYAASDHAVGSKQNNDRTCLLVVGIDENDVIWVLPDAIWKRMDTEKAVESMIDLMARHRPIKWYGGRDHITKSIGPFLRKRMQERKTFVAIEEVPEHSDKKQKAQPLLGRMAMGMVRFPAFAPWFADARDEMLKFPNGRHEDFVDALAHIPRRLDSLARPSTDRPKPVGPRVGTLAWVKHQSNLEARYRRPSISFRGM